MQGLAILALLPLALAFSSSSPTWTTDSNFQAGTASLITSATSAPFSQAYTVAYASTAATNPPGVTFGIKAY